MDFPREEVDVDQLKEVIHQKNNELQIMQARLQEAEIKIENLENELDQPEELWKRHAKSFTWRSIPILLTAGMLLEAGLFLFYGSPVSSWRRVLIMAILLVLWALFHRGIVQGSEE